MVKAIQRRTLATRAKLISAATNIVSAKGYAALRVEDVVQEAGVAKGTFFAHFTDKDALMERLIGARINAFLDDAEARPPPLTVDTIVSYLMPLVSYMASERYVFDVILRHSGAAAKEEIGVIAQTFTRQVNIVTAWMPSSPFRKDISAHLLADGVQAFIVQAIALHFCAINNSHPMENRIKTYLEAWLQPHTVIQQV